MIVNNSPLGFAKPNENCIDCREDNFVLPVALADNPEFQANILCAELTGGEEKKSCEENQIGPYTADFKRYHDDGTVKPLLATYLISESDMRFNAFAAPDGGNLFSTPIGFLEANKCYWLRYTISGYTEGWIQTVKNVGLSERTTGPNPARRANGTFTEIFCTDSNGRLRFQVGPNDNISDVSTFILSNIFIGCIRYSELYEFSGTDDDLEQVTFTSPTTISKGTTVDPVLVSLIEIPFIPGQTYKICFNIVGSTLGSVDLLFGPTTPITYSGNGFYCTEIEYVDTDITTKLEFDLSSDFDGSIGDITVHLIADYRIGLFDMEGNEVENVLQVTKIDNALKIGFSPNAPGENILSGCFQIGLSDNCSNYKNQFYGNILEAPDYYSVSVDSEDSHKITRQGDNFQFDMTTYDGSSYSNYFILKDSICYGKLYDVSIKIDIVDHGNPITNIAGFVVLAGIKYGFNQVVSGSSTIISFDDLIAGDEQDEQDFEAFRPFFAAVAGHGYFLLQTVVQGTINNDDGVELSISANLTDAYVIMDQLTPQFCPEYYSVPLSISTEAPCDTVLIKYRNLQDAFGFDYTSDIFNEDSGFFNYLRIPAKLWNPSYPRVIQLQKNSTGFRNNYYADVDKKYTLNTGRLTEPIHDALTLAVGHDKIIIDSMELVCSSEDYTPEWNKDTTASTVELEFFLQQSRKLNTKC